MDEVVRMVEKVKDYDTTVLVTGESGTGKELVARMLHHGGRSGTGSFVAINCGAIPETLLESELFGYRKGAFTDAKSGPGGG
jgi:two-component system response regulator AtoC